MGWSGEQIANARVIASVGAQMGMSQRDILIGLMTAMQESGLRNLKYGDRDSQGLFQQRPSQGWGSVSQVTDPRYAASKFFSTLKGVKGRDSMGLSQAAQKVQRSAYPSAYAKHEDDMRGLLSKLGGDLGDPGFDSFYGDQGTTTQAANRTVTPGMNGLGDTEALGGVQGISAPAPMGLEAPGAPLGLEAAQPGAGLETPTPGGPAAPNVTREMPTFDQYMGAASDGASGAAADVIAKARQFLGTPYVWGGTSPLGFDCSGFVQYVFKQFGVNLPRVSYQQSRSAKKVDKGEMQAGDLVFFDYSSRNPGADHVGIYIGNG